MNIIQSTNEYDALLKDNQSVFVDFYADWCGPPADGWTSLKRQSKKGILCRTMSLIFIWLEILFACRQELPMEHIPIGNTLQFPDGVKNG